MMNSAPNTLRYAVLFGLFGLVALLGGPACGGGMAADEGLRNSGGMTIDEKAQEARTELATHSIDQAHRIYGALLDKEPDNGHAAAGRAVTRAMLLPGSEAASEILIENLGARSPLDPVAAIYAENGYLYWMSRGARWEDEGQFSGIKNLIADELPWEKDRLDSLSAFVSGLDSPVGDARQNLLRLSTELRAIEDNVATALDHPEFSPLVVPGQTFHDKDLTLVLGPSEIAGLGAAAAGLRGILEFVLAYRHDWSLQQAFGAHWEDVADDSDGEKARWTPWDFTLDYLDRRMLRELFDSSSERFDQSRQAFRRSLQFVSTAIDHGLEAPESGSLAWSRVDDAYARDLQKLADALDVALGKPSELPMTDPTVTADLSVLFDDGRVLPEERTWLSWTEHELESDGDSGTSDDSKNVEIRWELNDRALQRIFIDGIFMPGFEIGSDEAPTFRFTGDPAARFVDALFGPTLTRFEDAYLARR